WRMNIPLTDSYSRDIDGTPLIINNRIYLGAENGYLYKINPFKTELRDSIRQPIIDYSVRLYDNGDILAHQWNLVSESSPAYMDSTIYITSGSGHIYGIDINTGKKVFDFKTGSDMDGSPVITGDRKLVCPIEKQYIRGPGGVIKLDPKMEEEKSVLWYFPTGSSIVPGWEGGVIGSPAIYERGPEKNHLCAFMSVDGYLYVVALNRTVPDSNVIGFDSLTYYPTPEFVYKKYIGGSISTPVFAGEYLIAGGYDCRLRIFKITGMNIRESVSINLGGGIESTPAVLNSKIYIGCRNGYIYCIGDK
ncbi:MAG: hypothetical protein SVK54_04950, partial [candidate division WOR-3 bacterium]|nr:hypothetical protein [candidate division WOR-3 bacterium]